MFQNSLGSTPGPRGSGLGDGCDCAWGMEYLPKHTHFPGIGEAEQEVGQSPSGAGLQHKWHSSGQVVTFGWDGHRTLVPALSEAWLLCFFIRNPSFLHIPLPVYLG